MKVYSNYSLVNHNSFKLDIKAKYFTGITNTNEIPELFMDKKYSKENVFVLGSGTNVLFRKNYDGLVVHIATKGINILESDNSKVVVEVNAGESWNGFVQWAVNNGFSGVENMVLIPGTIGAAASQNIAAYGQNFEDIFHSLTAFNLISKKIETFDKNKCQFGYRESFFKKGGLNKYIITEVKVSLLKRLKVNTEYHSRYETLEDELKRISSPPYNIRDITKAVSVIRERKFPDWEKIGTAGSFFLNPVISKKQLAELQKKVPGVQFYPIDKLSYPLPDDQKFKYEEHVKIAAGWLLEELGWKGKWIGKVGTSPNQSLVIITQKGATPEEILSFANKMRADVKKVYGIDLYPEVNII
jgi:UDP-N-acetylmuramate dehydrogenase